jgi:hypothetical protein
VKRGATENPKFRRLCRALGVEPWGAVGVLESLWQFTARVARAGNVGRWSDEDIAEGIGWRSRPAVELVAVLIAERWLDEHQKYRLVVHDWSEHADDAVHLALARVGEFFADGTKPKTTRLQHKEREKIEELYEAQSKRRRAHKKHTASARHGVSFPSPSSPYPPKPDPEEGEASSAGADPHPSEAPHEEEKCNGDDLAEWWNEMVDASGGDFPKVTLPLSSDRRRKADLRARAQKIQSSSLARS